MVHAWLCSAECAIIELRNNHDPTALQAFTLPPVPAAVDVRIYDDFTLTEQQVAVLNAVFHKLPEVNDPRRFELFFNTPKRIDMYFIEILHGMTDFGCTETFLYKLLTALVNIAGSRALASILLWERALVSPCNGVRKDNAIAAVAHTFTSFVFGFPVVELLHPSLVESSIELYAVTVMNKVDSIDKYVRVFQYVLNAFAMWMDDNAEDVHLNKRPRVSIGEPTPWRPRIMIEIPTTD